ncbi:uncharacterized protein K452DRAFT_257519 [Aplosporella prunicola CBS 121167]|uniref:Anaphase-promoting complex subunit 4 WD40 domain-containing protein n=1 Tax=Aplosporella prunicola CBS 121167 TaxID=1176127 RepID=A0A6A6AZX4_9PEZI|nr:uncharacterized protein K452DRAFT_257519 [Aplosporella prunicola CBS 121167]KAF2137469.1 hypothetical protein K452DRAFT_257519 [Aplosporella prunicola CBS 121167]
MPDQLPSIRITNPHSQDAIPLSTSPAPSTLPPKAGEEGGRSATPSSTRSKAGAAPATKPRRDSSASTTHPANNGSAEGAGSGAPIDPLSQQIFKRTNTPTDVLRQFGPSGGDSTNIARPYTSDGSPGPKSIRDVSKSDTISIASKDKRKGVSFLSRIMGNKKKDEDISANEEELGQFRPEGMDAELFSQPIDNVGFNPRHPQPPDYIKIRSRFTTERNFDHVFVAQELRAKPQPQEGQRPATSAGPGAANRQLMGQNPVWALEFSKDGKYLAAGGQDKVVRVWAVISTPEERRSHEMSEEATPGTFGGQGLRLHAPVFQNKTFREYTGHESTILDLSWSKNNFLLSSSMDKTVRLWHVSRSECLCTFKHADFVPSIQFHPKDDRFFLAGSLDAKLRLWSIPDKSVAFWNQLPEMITAVSFSPDGKTAIAGTLSGLCLFYDTEGLKYQTQIHVKSSRGKNAKGSKITGIQVMHLSGEADITDLKMLVSSNDSRVRLYSWRDKNLDIKFRGQQNNFSQIRASFSDDGRFVICGSEDRKAYIWTTGPTDSENQNRNQRPVEMFDAHSSITTCAILAPTKTRQLLSNSEDPLYDTCNPPPVTLVSKAESVSSKAASVKGDTLGTPASHKSSFRKLHETPAYAARSTHPDGQIIVTADYTGQIKVFRQDCAYDKRRNDSWETSSVFSKRTMGSSRARSNSTKTKASARSRRDSTATTATMPSADRILSWRQHIGGGGSTDNKSAKSVRSASPSKFSVASSARSSHARVDGGSPLVKVTTNEGVTTSEGRRPSAAVSEPVISPPHGLMSPDSPSSKANPLMIHGGQSYAFYNPATWRNQLENNKKNLQPPLTKKASYVSRLSSEESSAVEGEEQEVTCKECGGTEFKAIARIDDEGHTLLCTQCGVPTS